jgi:uncharacterized circularly permuted ATP-grasp superfamily protein/uncharacterized alpha-E superfamily protein
MPGSDQYDECRAADGTVRPAWKSLVSSLDELGPAGISKASNEIERLVRESGANFQFSDIIKQSARPWKLAAIPLVLSAREWQSIEAGLKQRLRLLEAILGDLLGEQKLLKARVLPAELLSANYNYFRVYHELPQTKPRLDITATDLARNKDGTWWVTGDRTRAPSGLGYALENRVITSRVFQKLLRGNNVVRVASFFSSLQQHLNSLAAGNPENPRVAILTPGQHSYRYIEDAYLARYLGYTMVQGRDLAVRGSRLNLKTLGGLLPIDVLCRHISDRKSDPLELKPSSQQGATGLLQTIRSGHVAVANSIGSTLAQMPALMPFLPAASKFLFGEEPSLPSIGTYWCGGQSERTFVLENLDELILRPAFHVSPAPPIVPAEMTTAEKSKLIDQIKAQPHSYVAQYRPSRSTTPVWHEGKLESWHVALRSFQVQTASGVEVMPGGLARVSPDPRTLDQSPASGRLGLDCWIANDKPVDQEITLLRQSHSSITLARGGAEMPSRVGESLFWLGRSAERSESIARLLRATLIRIAGETQLQDIVELPRMVAALAALGQLEPDHAIAGLGEKLPSLEKVLPASLFDTEKPGGLLAGIRDMGQKAMSVHDRVSLDAYRIIKKIGDHLITNDQSDAIEIGAVINRLDGIVTDLQAFSGLASESMTRTHGWRFLELGRRIERAYQTAELLSAMLVNPIDDEYPVLESILQTTDSMMTYRSRYLLQMQPTAVIDLLVNDETNPRSIGYQLLMIDQHLRELPSDDHEVSLGTEEKMAREVLHRVTMSDPSKLAQANTRGVRVSLNELLAKLTDSLPDLSDAIAARYLIHTGATVELTGRMAPMASRSGTGVSGPIIPKLPNVE